MPFHWQLLQYIKIIEIGLYFAIAVLILGIIGSIAGENNADSFRNGNR